MWQPAQHFMLEIVMSVSFEFNKLQLIMQYYKCLGAGLSSCKEGWHDGSTSCQRLRGKLC